MSSQQEALTSAYAMIRVKERLQRNEAIAMEGAKSNTNLEPY